MKSTTPFDLLSSPAVRELRAHTDGNWDTRGDEPNHEWLLSPLNNDRGNRIRAAPSIGKPSTVTGQEGCNGRCAYSRRLAIAPHPCSPLILVSAQSSRPESEKTFDGRVASRCVITQKQSTPWTKDLDAGLIGAADCCQGTVRAIFGHLLSGAIQAA